MIYFCVFLHVFVCAIYCCFLAFVKNIFICHVRFMGSYSCDPFYVVLFIWSLLCGPVYVVFSMWLFLCGSFYVVLFMWSCLCGLFYVVLFTWLLSMCSCLCGPFYVVLFMLFLSTWPCYKFSVHLKELLRGSNPKTQYNKIIEGVISFKRSHDDFCWSKG